MDSKLFINNFISMLVIRYFLIFITQVNIAQAQPNGRVNFFRDFSNTNKAMNPYKRFPNGIRYWIPAESRNLLIDMGTGSQNRPNILTVDLQLIIAGAAVEWERGTELAIEPATTLENANLIFNATSFNDGENPFGLAESVVRRSGPQIIYLWRPAIQEDLRSESSAIQRLMGNSSSQQDAANILLRTVIIHEIGHILGFEHPELFRANDVANAQSMTGITIFQSLSNPGVPIMSQDAGSYLRQLHEHNGGTSINFDNVRISTQELAALNVLRTNSACECFPYNQLIRSMLLYWPFLGSRN